MSNYEKIKKNSGLTILILILILLFFFLINSSPQRPLVQLSDATISKLLTANIENIVLFNRDARPLQILDLSRKNEPQVRHADALVKYMEREKTQTIKDSNKKVNFIKSQAVSETYPYKLVVNEKNKKDVHKEEPIVSLLENEVLTLRDNGIFYVEYRDSKDQQIQVVELTEKGTCIACLLSTLPTSPFEKTSAQMEDENSLLDFVIPTAEACHWRHDCGCSSGKCKKVSEQQNCCNCN